MKNYPYKKILRGLLVENKVSSGIINKLFHLLYYNSPETWMRNTYLGYPLQQCPFDMYLYQEIIFLLKPNFILQTGVNFGGSLLFFANLLDLINAPKDALVIGIDIKLTDQAKTIVHPRVKLIEADSTDRYVVDQVRGIVGNKLGFVSLDSDHSKSHVLKEINIYKEFVALGSYIVVEDSNINGHPVHSSFGPGPLEAVREFLKSNYDFIRDDNLWKRNLLSFHNYGWIKRIR